MLREELRTAKTTLAAAAKWGNPKVTAAAEEEVAALTRRLEARRPVNARFQSALDRAAAAKKRWDDAVAAATALQEQLEEALTEADTADAAFKAREAEVRAMQAEVATPAPAGAAAPSANLGETVQAALEASTALLQALASIGADALPPDVRSRAESAFEKLAQAHGRPQTVPGAEPPGDPDSNMGNTAEPGGGPKRLKRTPGEGGAAAGAAPTEVPAGTAK